MDFSVGYTQTYYHFVKSVKSVFPHRAPASIHTEPIASTATAPPHSAAAAAAVIFLCALTDVLPFMSCRTSMVAYLHSTVSSFSLSFFASDFRHHIEVYLIHSFLAD